MKVIIVVECRQRTSKLLIKFFPFSVSGKHDELPNDNPQIALGKFPKAKVTYIYIYIRIRDYITYIYICIGDVLSSFFIYSR